MVDFNRVNVENLRNSACAMNLNKVAIALDDILNPIPDDIKNMSDDELLKALES